MVPEGVAPESLIGVDNQVITTAPMITDDDIFRSVTTNQQEQWDEDDDNDEKVGSDTRTTIKVSSRVGNKCYSNSVLYSSN